VAAAPDEILVAPKSAHQAVGAYARRRAASAQAATAQNQNAEDTAAISGDLMPAAGRRELHSRRPDSAEAGRVLPKPRLSLEQNTYAYETMPLIKERGFREYDARWIFGEEINPMGVQALGLGLGTLLHELGTEPAIVTGHDFRSYSSTVKLALVTGLMAAGMRVSDIGLAMTPMAYFAQFELDIPAVAMVTASHNENGWTGLKMGANRPLTFGPQEMKRLREIVLSGASVMRDGGSYRLVQDLPERYLADLAARPKLRNRIRAVVACGNGTAGAFIPKLLEKIGVEVVPLDIELDHSFPRYNPNPEDLKMLHAIRDKVLETGAAIGLGFDGDGDRCGVVDNEGKEIFADKVGVLLARELSTRYPGSTFVVDVKSTGLFAVDPRLKANGVHVDYWKTGHSYMKQRVKELSALAGFEKSGHYFFSTPIGRGYDDGAVAALAILDMLDRNPQTPMADLYRTLPATWGSPTMSAHCDDGKKYAVVDEVTRYFQNVQARQETICGEPIAELVTLNGVRVVLRDGTWGLVRASSNKPEIVVVVESPQSEQRMRDMFEVVDAALRRNPGVRGYNQTI
jgi:phosphomannomutase/phosphoglucomutase